MNRLRSTSSMMMCSHCSAASFANSRMTSRATSQMSLFHNAGTAAHSINANGSHIMMASCTNPPTRRTSTSTTVDGGGEGALPCKICLMDTPARDMVKLQACSCAFCSEVSKEDRI